MRKITVKQISLIFGIILFSLLNSSCIDVFHENEQLIDRAIVSFSVSDDAARTVLPQVSLNDVAYYKLFGGLNNAQETILVDSFSNTNISVLLESGTWNFTLNAFNDNDEHILQGKIQNHQININGTNQVNFVLSVLNSGIGNIQISLNIPVEAGITQIKVNGGISTEIINYSNTGIFVFTKNNITADDYLINFELYRGNALRAVVSELVLVRSNLTSVKTITLVGENLKPLPPLTGTVSITGVASVNQILTANTSSLSDDSVVSYQWKRGNTNIGTNSNNYTIQPIDLGSYITVTVTRLDFFDCVFVTSAPIGPVTGSDGIQWVTRVNFSGTEQTTTVNLNNLNGNDIYLVKVNTSDLVVNAGSTGSVQSVSPILNSYNGVLQKSFINNNDDLLIMGRPNGEELLLPLPRTVNTLSKRISPSVSFIPPVVGDTRNFWVESSYGNRTYIQKSAILLATGRHGNIWVMDNSITTSRAQELSAKFDIIYPASTNILGYEYGGKPGHHEPGGKDGDPKIQILVFNIVLAGGYFSSKDFYTDEQLPAGWKSNNAEMIYLDANTAKSSTFKYTTLAHELQHMINFNLKRVEKSLNYSPSWYDEMLSMMTEDVIAEKVGISITSSNHVVKIRIPTFLGSYADEGIVDWNTLELVSYATKLGFGSYLLRNYGGADLLRRILANDTLGIESITSALSEITPGLTFKEALLRYGEAMLYSDPIPSGVMSYNKTVTNTINGTTYTAHAFDIWNITRSGGGTGPIIYNLNQRSMRPYSISLHSADAWKNRTGAYSITMQRPSDPNVVFILMVK